MAASTQVAGTAAASVSSAGLRGTPGGAEEWWLLHQPEGRGGGAPEGLLTQPACGTADDTDYCGAADA